MTERELNRVRDLRKEIRREEQRLNVLRKSAEDLVPLLDGMPHAKNQTSRVEKLAGQIVDAEELLNKLKDQMADAAVELTAELRRADLTVEEYEVITHRYVTCKNFLDIQNEMNFSDARVFYFHRHALKKLKLFDSKSTVGQQ